MNRGWKYILALLLLVAACDGRCLDDTLRGVDENSCGATDDGNDIITDMRSYHEDTFSMPGPEEDDVLWLNEQDVSVSTDFPAPSWF